MLPPTFRESLPCSVTPLWNHPHKINQTILELTSTNVFLSSISLSLKNEDILELSYCRSPESKFQARDLRAGKILRNDTSKGLEKQNWPAADVEQLGNLNLTKDR